MASGFGLVLQIDGNAGAPGKQSATNERSLARVWGTRASTGGGRPTFQQLAHRRWHENAIQRQLSQSPDQYIDALGDREVPVHENAGLTAELEKPSPTAACLLQVLEADVDGQLRGNRLQPLQLSRVFHLGSGTRAGSSNRPR